MSHKALGSSTRTGKELDHLLCFLIAVTLGETDQLVAFVADAVGKVVV